MLVRLTAGLLAALLCAHAAVSKEALGVADQARALPPEFAADLLLRLAGSTAASDLKWKRELIEDAFLLAGHAQAPLPLANDERSAPRFAALALEMRAVEAMLALDPPRARTMFQDIPSLTLPRLTCQDRATPDVSAYYQTALELFNRAFTPADRAKGADLAFLRDRIASIDSPSQVVPALKLLDQVELKSTARSDLAAAFAMALDRIHGGSREFAASEPLLMGAAVPEMHERLVLPTLRTYIVRQVSGPRCGDLMGAGQLPESAMQFNKLISRIDLQGARIAAITAEEAAPLRDDGTFAVPADGDPYRQAMGYARFLNQTPFSILPAEGLRFLEQQYDGQGDRTLWSAEFRMMVLDQRHDLDQLAHSGNPVIAAYAALEKLVGFTK